MHPRPRPHWPAKYQGLAGIKNLILKPRAIAAKPQGHLRLKEGCLYLKLTALADNNFKRKIKNKKINLLLPSSGLTKLRSCLKDFAVLATSFPSLNTYR